MWNTVLAIFVTAAVIAVGMIGVVAFAAIGIAAVADAQKD